MVHKICLSETIMGNIGNNSGTSKLDRSSVKKHFQKTSETYETNDGLQKQIKQ